LLASDSAVADVFPDEVVTLDVKPYKPPKSSSSARSSSSLFSSSSVPSQSSSSVDQTRQPIPWGVLRVRGPSPTTAFRGVAFIIDTGIDTSHSDLVVDLTRGISCVDAEPYLNDSNGHGTHVAGIVAALDNDHHTVGVALGARVVPVKVLDRSGSGYMSDVICGVEHVASQADASGFDVANMSLSGSAFSLLDSSVYYAAAHARFTLSAGNSRTRASLYSPARVNRAGRIFTVSAMDANDAFASFSNYGNPPIDYAAPGVAIYSLYKGDGVATMSGTSMAAPHVAGILLDPRTPVDGCVTDGKVSGDRDRIADPIAVLPTL